MWMKSDKSRSEKVTFCIILFLYEIVTVGKPIETKQISGYQGLEEGGSEELLLNGYGVCFLF